MKKTKKLACNMISSAQKLSQEFYINRSLSNNKIQDISICLKGDIINENT